MSQPPSQAPPASLILRATRPQDAEAIVVMQSLPGFRAGTLQLPFPSPEAVRARIERRGPEATGLVATVDGTIIGAAGLERFQGRRGHAGSIGVGVHDAWTGRGVGTALLGAVVDLAERWLGLRRLELTVFADNAPALALYARFGFAVEGRMRAYALRDGVFADVVAMARLGGPELPPYG